MAAEDDLDPDHLEPDEDETAENAEHEYQEWIDRIKAREKDFEQTWWKFAKDAVDLYDGSKASSQDVSFSDQAYNILYSNTEVLLPSLYSSTPKPDVRTRYKDQAQALKPIPDAIERLLVVFSDQSTPGKESLDESMAETVLSSLTAGMGFVRLRYYSDRAIPIATEAGHYKGLIWGKARKWSKVNWIAFRHDLSKSEFFKTFKIAKEDEAKLSANSHEEADAQTEKKNEPTGVVVYEVWNKGDRSICFLCEDWEGILVQEDDDYLELDGFFPTPGPLLMTMKPGKLEPIPLYQYYRNQAEELNRVTVRLNKVLSAIRVRGAYNGMLGGDLEKILQDEEMENGLVPAAEAGTLAFQNGGFDKNIWLLPIDKLITVATQLYQARQQIKQVIYELTGISDIIRGSSVASETATAQDLKNKWGTIRLRRMQAMVANYVRDLYRLTVDGACSVLDPVKWAEITQIKLPSMVEKQAAIQQLQMFKERAMLQQTMGMPQDPNQPPPQPNPQLVQTAQTPSWEEVIKKIAGDQNRTFLVNVQTSSTVDLDTQADKDDVTEFMNSMGQLMAGLQPLATLGPSGLEACKAILVAVCQRYKFGLSIVDSIMALQPPPPPGPDPVKQQEMQMNQQQAQLDMQVKKAETDAKLAEIQAKKDLAITQVEIEKEKLALEREKMKLDLAKVQLNLRATQAKLAIGVSGAKEMAAIKAENASKAEENQNASVPT